MTTKLLTNTTFTSKTGRTYWIDENGKATLFVEAQSEDDDQYAGCECEQDWNCGLHRNRAGTWTETRSERYEADDHGW